MRVVALLGLIIFTATAAAAQPHRFSTLFTAHSVRDDLGTDAGIDAAIAWCRETSISKVYLETFRNGYQVDSATIDRANKRLADAGLLVSGCVAPTSVGKPSTGPRKFRSCYTDLPTQQRAREIFTFAARHFDEVMIDDFWSTDCECDECDAGRKAKRVKVADQVFTVEGDSWTDYRLVLMRQVSRWCVIDACRAANPNGRIILKFPNWYDDYQLRGYDVINQTADFDMIWVGNETREIDNPFHPGIPQYAGYFIQRWLENIGGAKCGGGWFDPHETLPPTYIEQARQTILGGAQESVLFSYSSLRPGPQLTQWNRHGPDNIIAFRKQVPELLQFAAEVARRKHVGIAAYKPPHSPRDEDFHIYDFAGMVGLPLEPCHEFPTDAPAAFFADYALTDPDFAAKLKTYIATGRPLLITNNLAARLQHFDLSAKNVQVLNLTDRARTWMDWSRGDLNQLRAPLLAAFNVKLDAPAGVALYLFSDGSLVLENFTDALVEVRCNDEQLRLPPRRWSHFWK